MAVRDLADVCSIDVLDDDGALRRLKVLARDPEKQAAVDELSKIRIERAQGHPITAVLESKEPLLIRDVTSAMLHAWARDDEHLRIMQRLDAKSAVAVPLLAHGRLCGVLAFASSTRVYGNADLKLAQELAHRAALSIENARLYATAKRAVQVRDEVLSIVAHDLRNPLSTVLMQISLLRRHDGGPERRSTRPAEIIERAAMRMSRLIRELLDVTRIEAGRLAIERERVPTAAIVAEAVDAQQGLAGAASLELRAQVAADVLDVSADRDRLLQIFENLIGNAMKFTPPGGRITVGASAAGNETLFWVADTGPGIASDDVPRLFDRFWQGRRATGLGAGLGLPIVKGIVEAHGGQVCVESAPGRGTTIFFTMPTAQPLAARRPSAAA